MSKIRKELDRAAVDRFLDVLAKLIAKWHLRTAETAAMDDENVSGKRKSE